MMDLLRSEEFGDWLINQIESETPVAVPNEDPSQQAARRARIQALEVAKGVLLEFLLVKSKMLKAAARKRGHSVAKLK